MQKVLVTGASGLLGINLVLQAANQYEVTGVVYSQQLKGIPFQVISADLTDEMELKSVIEQVKPELIINCAALANVDACEKNPVLAEDLNVTLPLRLAGICTSRAIQLVHISTDAVFDGISGNYRETDQPNPINVYARTKLAGEVAVHEANSQALIARVNFYGYSLSRNRSLAEFFLYNLAAGLTINGFTDVFFCPLLVQDLIDVLFQMSKKKLSGIYHVVSPEKISKYEFGVKIAKAFDLNESLIIPTSVKEGGLAAKRSPNLTLKIDKLLHDLGAAIPGQDQGINRFLNLYQKEYPEELRSYSNDTD